MFHLKNPGKLNNLYVVFSTIEDGNMSFEFGDDVVVDNRKKFLQKVDIDINSCEMIWVQHSDKIVKAPSEALGSGILDYQKAPKADGIMTDKRGVYLCVLTADCIPLVLHNTKKEVVTLLHIGWKGADLEIVKKVVILLNRNFNTEAKDIIAIIGPCIRKESYIQTNPQQKFDEKWSSFINKTGNGDYQIDVVGLVKRQLKESGVTEIIDCEIDTAKDERFFSYYRDRNRKLGDKGRFLTLVGFTE